MTQKSSRLIEFHPGAPLPQFKPPGEPLDLDGRGGSSSGHGGYVVVDYERKCLVVHGTEAETLTAALEAAVLDVLVARPHWQARLDVAVATLSTHRARRLLETTTLAHRLRALGVRALTEYARHLTPWPAEAVVALAYQLLQFNLSPRPVRALDEWRAALPRLEPHHLSPPLLLDARDADAAAVMALVHPRARELMAVFDDGSGEPCRRRLAWRSAQDELLYGAALVMDAPAALDAHHAALVHLIDHGFGDDTRPYPRVTRPRANVEGEEEAEEATEEGADPWRARRIAQWALALAGVLVDEPRPLLPDDDVQLEAEFRLAADFIDARRPPL